MLSLILESQKFESRETFHDDHQLDQRRYKLVAVTKQPFQPLNLRVSLIYHFLLLLSR